MMAAVMFFTVNQASARFEGEQMMPPQRMGAGFGGPGGHRGPHMDSEQMIKATVARLTKQLQLTQEQSAEVEKIYPASGGTVFIIGKIHSVIFIAVKSKCYFIRSPTD